MDFDRRVAEVLQGAETALARLAAEAAGSRDYARAGALLAIAAGVADLGRSQGFGDGEIAPTGQSAPMAAAVAPLAGKHGPDRPAPGFQAPVPRSREPKRGAKGDYPRFRQEGGALIKVGWSKADGATYEHRSPRQVLDLLVAGIVKTGARGQRFTTEHLLPLLDSAGSEMPSYQAYLCLAWLVAKGLIERHGRQGYTVANAAGLPAAVEQAWAALPGE